MRRKKKRRDVRFSGFKVTLPKENRLKGKMEEVQLRERKESGGLEKVLHQFLRN